jgi:phospholipid/cholesterol/gamma-HCH transport system ATP-binding protein
VGTRIAMLYEGRVRQVGTVEEIRHTTDPVVRQFIEGRAELAQVQEELHESPKRVTGQRELA